MKYFLPAIATTLGLALFVLGWTLPAHARTVCIPFAQTEYVMMDTDFINTCFDSREVVKVKTIFSGKSGNMVEVILRQGMWFYKNGMTAPQMRACIDGRGPCDKYQNVRLRDLTRGDTSIFKKRLHPKRGPKDTSLNRDAVVSSGP